MFKRLLRISLSLLLVASFLIMTVPSSVATASATPRYSYITFCMAGLSIENGVAEAEGAVSGTLLPTKVCVILQREEEEGWMNIAVWINSNDAGLSSAGGTVTLTQRGFSYRTLVHGTVYSDSGEFLESETMCSDIKRY